MHSEPERLRRKFLIAGAVGVTLLGAAAMIENGSGANQQQIKSLESAHEVFEGKVIIGEGVNVRSSTQMNNGNRAGDPSNVVFKVGDGQKLVMDNPLRVTDRSGDLWVGARKPDSSNTVGSDSELANQIGWINVSQLGPQLKVIMKPSGGEVSTTDITITEQGVIQNTESAKPIEDAAQSHFIQTETS